MNTFTKPQLTVLNYVTRVTISELIQALKNIENDSTEISKNDKRDFLNPIYNQKSLDNAEKLKQSIAFFAFYDNSQETIDAIIDALDEQSSEIIENLSNIIERYLELTGEDIITESNRRDEFLEDLEHSMTDTQLKDFYQYWARYGNSALGEEGTNFRIYYNEWLENENAILQEVIDEVMNDLVEIKADLVAMIKNDYSEDAEAFELVSALFNHHEEIGKAYKVSETTHYWTTAEAYHNCPENFLELINREELILI